MLSRWPIRNKLLVGIALLLVIELTLSVSGFQGTYAYRELCVQYQQPRHRVAAGN